MTDRGDVTTLGILALRHGDVNDAKGNPWGFFPLVNFAAEWTVAPDEDGLLVEKPKKDTVGVIVVEGLKAGTDMLGVVTHDVHRENEGR